MCWFRLTLIERKEMNREEGEERKELDRESDERRESERQGEKERGGLDRALEMRCSQRIS